MDNDNEVLKTIYNRRSVRDFQKDEVPEDLVKEIIRAGSYAPSNLNKQPWGFIVIKNKKLMRKLSDRAVDFWIEQTKTNSEIIEVAKTDPLFKNLLNMMSKPDFSIFYNAPVMIMVLGRSNAEFPQIDCSLAAESMMLAARSLGIGSCWIGLAMPLGNNRELLTEIGVPSEYNLVAPLIFGYPVKKDQAASPRNQDLFLKWIN
jgi:nitroreductase